MQNVIFIPIDDEKELFLQQQQQHFTIAATTTTTMDAIIIIQQQQQQKAGCRNNTTKAKRFYQTKMTRNPILLKSRLTCTHGALTLSLRPECGGAAGVEFRVRVTSYPKDRPFERGLVIRSGTVLKLCYGKKAHCFVTVRVFNPIIQYGRFCASGVLCI